MPAKKSRVAVKTMLLAPAGSLISWGIQQAITGDPVTGAAATVIGGLLMAGFVAFQEYDIFYEAEIIDIIRANSGQITEGGKTAAEEIGDAVENHTNETGSED